MIVKTIKVIICTGSFVYTSYVLCNFMYFLSSHTDRQQNVHILEDDKTLSKTLSLLLFDAALLSMFIIQHSVMANEYLKNIYNKFNMEDIERSVYNISCALVLNVLIAKWKYLPWISLWNIDTNHNTHVWTVMVSIHILAWFIIYSGCLMMDMSELAGIKQVYYNLSARPPPMNLKSMELRRFLSHMRHPSFIGFLIIFWVHPVMSIDKLLMATLMTIYMLVMWNIDQKDFNYHMGKIQRKKMGLSCY